MRDGKTRKLKTMPGPSGIDLFLKRFDAKLMAVSGACSGNGFTIESERTIIGRGPGVDITVEDPVVSRQHAVIEFVQDGFTVRDLGSTNGMRVNGVVVNEGTLGHGDCFDLGTQQFRLVLEEREESPNTYVLNADA